MYEYRNKKTKENIVFGLVLMVVIGVIYFIYSVILT